MCASGTAGAHPGMWTGSLQMTVISKEQNGPMWNWLLFRDPFSFISFFLFYVTSLASCKSI